MLDRTSVEQEIRRRLGDLPVAQLPAEQVSAALDAALREFSRYRPLKDTASLRILTGVNSYGAPDGSYAVEDYAFMPDAAIGLFVEDPMFWQQYESDGDRWNNLRKEMLLYKSDIEPDVQIVPTATGPEIRIFPTPSHNGKAEVRVRILRAIEDVNESDLEHIMRYAQGDCLEYIGRKRAKSVTKVPTATGQLHLDDGKELREEGCELKKKFHESLGGGATALGVG